jgi:multicomponent Na+:H+ antiporter subunit F
MNPMDGFRTWIALFLLLNVLAGLVRVARGPTFADRMLVAQLFGTTGVAMLLLLPSEEAGGALRDVALVFSLLASITVVAFTTLGPAHEKERR